MRTFAQTPVGRRQGRSPLRALRARLAELQRRGEDGFLLIEVMVSALMVALIAVGTFDAFDASNRVQHVERVRAQATTLAQQDEERLRSLGSSQLANLSEEKTTTLQKTKYTIVSKAEFVSDASGEASCSASGNGADYFKTISEVSWTGIGPRQKVIQTGLVSPPAGGELMVQIEDGRGGKVSGMSVTGTGPASLSATTGTSGCVIFGPLEEGTYEVNAKQTGYVNPAGESEVPLTSRSTTVTGQTTQSKTLQFNKPGAIKAELETAPASVGPPQTLNVIAAQTGMNTATNFVRLRATEASYTTLAITSTTTLFPFASPYTVYAGSCAANSPAEYGAEPSKAQVEPGATATTKVTEPAMIVLLYKGSKNTEPLIEKPEIYVKDVDTGTGCTASPAYFKLAAYAKPEAAKGALEQPGLPYGKYNVCAVFTNSKGEKKYVYKEKAENKNISTGEKVELFESSAKTGTSANCP